MMKFLLVILATLPTVALFSCYGPGELKRALAEAQESFDADVAAARAENDPLVRESMLEEALERARADAARIGKDGETLEPSEVSEWLYLVLGILGVGTGAAGYTAGRSKANGDRGAARELERLRAERDKLLEKALASAPPSP